MDMGIAGADEIQRPGGVARAKRLFEGGDFDPRILGQGFAGLQPLRQRRQFVAALERIARRHQPPELIEAKTSQGDFGHQQVPLMRRVEGTTEQADHHAALDMRHHGMTMGECGIYHLRDGPGRCREHGT